MSAAKLMVEPSRRDAYVAPQSAGNIPPRIAYILLPRLSGPCCCCSRCR